MGNSYAPGLSPVVGNGLPGNPQRNGSGLVPKVIDLYFIAAGTKIVTPPPGYKFFRVTVYGAGTQGRYDSSTDVSYTGAGGACAQSKIYEVRGGLVITATATNANFSASFYDRVLTCTYGIVQNPSLTGGVATGGDINFNGGNGATTSGSLAVGLRGGSGATPDGPGVNDYFVSGSSVTMNPGGSGDEFNAATRAQKVTGPSFGTWVTNAFGFAGSGLIKVEFW